MNDQAKLGGIPKKRAPTHLIPDRVGQAGPGRHTPLELQTQTRMFVSQRFA
jgi:hypothetical protein